ncbi:cytochrome c1 [Globomyces sp. JEL0801]|nr:cytochrome c1 [Globomyces sp. JEL0801]
MFARIKNLKVSPQASYLTKAVTGSLVGGYVISEFILTDERIKPVSDSLQSFKSSLIQNATDLGINPFPTAHAFSTADNGLHSPHYPWEFEKATKTFDHAALRRGYQVYREICSACHSMDYIYWRNLIGVSHTEEEVKAMAAEYEYRDGPNDEGEYFMRPGKPSDPMPKAYPNDEAARVANGGALPPDLSCISRARHGEANYIFALLTGYCDPPAGVSIREGLHYNPYFHGGAISMARAIYDEVVEFEDETPNSASQIAKDVSEFLHWASYPELDERKKMGVKMIMVCSALLGFSIWKKRHIFTNLKSKQIVYKPGKKYFYLKLLSVQVEIETSFY